MKTLNIITRRQFMQLSAAAALHLTMGCAPKKKIVDGKPMHHLSTGFRNFPPAPEPEMPGVSFLFRRIRDLYDKPKIPQGHIVQESQALSEFNNCRAAASITWIGHSTYLLRIEDKHLLIDPFFGKLASPLPVGPERFIPPGISLEKIPRIDGLVVSHNHYDHLDAKAVEALPGKEKITVFVPLGLRSFFAKRGYRDIRELDWHQSGHMGGVCLTALPAVHFSGRGLGDRNETLWCSWAIRTGGVSCFFAGDTAYSPTLFKEIEKGYHAFDIAIVPIGAYEPSNVMQPVHTNPEEAIRLANDVKADLIIPSHWGTITLTDEPPWEPVERYQSFAKKNGISDGRAVVMKIGETRRI